MTRQINLYNPALRARREWLSGKSLLNGIGVMIVLLGLYGGVVRWQNQQLTDEANRVGAELSRRQSELARLNEELAQRKVGKETEAALRYAEAALQALQAEMEQLMKRHVAGQTIAAIAHELNQPLVAVTSYAEAALRLLRAGNRAGPPRQSHARGGRRVR